MRAMVLAAGMGTRLGELTREMPKPMLAVGDRPLLEWILLHLRRHEIREIAVNLHFRPDIIRGHFGAGDRLGVTITYSEEQALLGTAGGVKRMEPFLRASDPFLVQYGDVLTDTDLGAMIRFHRDRRATATILVHRRAGSNSVVELEPDGRVVRFWERPTTSVPAADSIPWVNSGLMVASPGLFEMIPGDRACDLPRDVFPEVIRRGGLYGWGLEGFRCAIDSPERLEVARRAVEDGSCRIGQE